jgi:2,4-dichlorophenol 6-monooxygenase
MRVDHILFERHSWTSNLSKAQYLKQRSMELFRQHGTADPVIEKAGSMRYISRIQWATSLGGSGPFDRKQIASVEAFGGGEESNQAQTYM